MASLSSSCRCTYICPEPLTTIKPPPPSWTFFSNMSSTTSTSSFQPLRPPRSSLMYTLPLRRLRDILVHVTPGLTLSSVEDLPSTRLPRLYTLNLSEGKHLLLSVAPSLSIRLLRQEQTLLLSEATLIHFLEATVRPGPSDATPPSPPADGASGSGLSAVVPRLLKHSSNTREIGYPYSILDVGAGVPLSTISIYLSLPEQRTVDKQIGSLVRQLALITSPSGRFGPVPRVCGSPFVVAGAAGPFLNQGSLGWLPAFMSLVEGILRDGEDMSVLLPYEIIRAHFARLSWRLSAVTVPRLLIIDGGDAPNVLLERGAENEGSATPGGITLTGLRDWSQGIFGDPLLSSCFDGSSEAFLSGWRPEGSEDLIEDEEGGRARLLLYKCYRAVVEIVTDYYRPQSDSSRRELEWRRRLTSALTELENIDIEPSQAAKRSRSSATGSGTEDPSKRQRRDSGSAKKV